MNGKIYALRIKLSDFLNDPLEHLVIDKIHEIYKVHTFKLQLWYDEGEITSAGLKSFIEDCKYFDIIHIDPWKKFSSYEKGLKLTLKLLNFCYHQSIVHIYVYLI